jgi:hypothetical protein
VSHPELERAGAEWGKPLNQRSAAARTNSGGNMGTATKQLLPLCGGQIGPDNRTSAADNFLSNSCCGGAIIRSIFIPTIIDNLLACLSVPVCLVWVLVVVGSLVCGLVSRVWKVSSVSVSSSVEGATQW